MEARKNGVVGSPHNAKNYTPRNRGDQNCCTSLPLTPVHEVEIRSIFQYERTIDRITDVQLTAMLEYFESDIAAGRFVRLQFNWKMLLHEAEAISETCDAEGVFPQSDILHLAMVHLLQVEDFLTFRPSQFALISKVNAFKQARDTATGKH